MSGLQLKGSFAKQTCGGGLFALQNNSYRAQTRTECLLCARPWGYSWVITSHSPSGRCGDAQVGNTTWIWDEVTI